MKIIGCRGCSTSCGCGCGDDNACPAVDVNPWRLHRYQEFSVANWATSPGLIAPDGQPLDPGRLRPSCDACLPAGLLPGEPDDATSPALWVDATQPDLTSAGFGWIIHKIRVQHPRERERLTSKLDQLGCTLDGRRAVQIVLEGVGENAAASRFMRDWFIHRVVQGGQRKCSTTCGGSTVELWRDGYQFDGGTGRRLLTDVRGWIDSELDQDFSEFTPRTQCGVMFQVEASAADLIIEPDRETVDAGGFWFPIKQQFPDLLPTKQSVTRTTDTRKTELFVDLQLLPDGTLRACPNDFNPASMSQTIAAGTHFRVASAATIPETASTVTPEIEQFSHLEIRMIVADDGTITYTTEQPDLWAAFLEDVAANGIDPDAAPVVLTIQRKNSKFNPTCPTCPPGLRAAACAEDNNIPLATNGFINITALSGGAAGTGTYKYFWPSGGGLPAWLQRYMDFLNCYGGYNVNFASVLAESQSNVGGTGITFSGLDVYVFADGRVELRAVVNTNGGVTNDGSVSYIFDAPGMAYNGQILVSLSGPARNATATPILSVEEEADCVSDIDPQCSPRELITPSGSGSVPVTFTLDPTTGVITSSLNLANNNPINMEFNWEPTTPTDPTPTTNTEPTIPGCDVYIPANPQVTVNITAGTWAPVGWAAGQGFPRTITPEQFEIVSTEYGSNNSDPIVTSTTTLEPVDVATGCDGPCGPGTIIASGIIDAPDPCWPATVDVERRLWKSLPVQTSTATDYQATLTIEAGTTPLEGVVAYIVADDGDNATGSRSYPLRIRELGAGEKLVLRKSELVHVAADGTECDGADWIDHVTCGWEVPLIDCTAEVNVLVDYPWNSTIVNPPAPVLTLTPVSSV